MSDQFDQKPPITTTDAGIPAPSDDHSLTVGANGPILLQDHYLIQKMAQFNRERVPERVVHAKGTGAFGYFEVTRSASEWTKAAFLNTVGKRTPTLLRFSTVAGELGSADTVRDPRGFALKFYTEEGNYDLVGNNTPIFFVRDPIKFSDFIHSQKRMPDNDMRSHNAMWDFWSLSPEAMHQVTFLMSDRGTPRTLRHMNGYGSHTFLWVNAKDEKFWVKYHFKTEQGIENFTDAEATAMTAEDPDFHRRDLFESIQKKDFPVWRLEVQIMPFKDAETYRFNPFDLTKVWPHSDYPPITIGRLVLDRNPENFFAQIEQSSFEPANMVPGIGPSPDKMLLGRLFSYPDAHRYRIGTNYLQLPVNQPVAEVHSYNKDGAMRYRHNGNQPVYAPNSYNGPRADTERYQDPLWFSSGELVRTAYTLRAEDDDYGQAGTLYRKVLSATDRDHLASNIVGHMSNNVERAVQERALAHWYKVDNELGSRIAQGLGIAPKSELTASAD
ncbi:catalase [Reticulibacter mediterranei]|uniref:Catalase n=1 Tax=Reticulibacter mediterranei TaxID=2778369 RepID=A0A8J3ISK8_9CHLR|nr:catalase [Reticulibacter mediterranei]GHO97775.1 catalase [Reticulibacter mediterranei]